MRRKEREAFLKKAAFGDGRRGDGRCKAGLGHVFHRDRSDGVDEEHLSAAQGGGCGGSRPADCEHGLQRSPDGDQRVQKT